MACVDSQRFAGLSNPIAINILAHCGEHLHIQAQQRHIVGNIAAYAAQADGNFTGIGIRCNQFCMGASANIHIDTAYYHSIRSGAQHIAFTGNVAFFQQIGNMHRYRRPGDIESVCQLLLGDHGIGRDQIENLSFSLCHPAFPFLFLYICLYYSILFILSIDLYSQCGDIE